MAHKLPQPRGRPHGGLNGQGERHAGYGPMLFKQHKHLVAHATELRYTYATRASYAWHANVTQWSS